MKPIEKYVFRKYSTNYQAFFKAEKERLVKVLGSAAKIEHVGSTAIIGLGGKGIVDILIGVSKSKTAAAKKKLMKSGYLFRANAGTPERLFFRRDYQYKQKKRRVHLHLTKFNGQDWIEMILFRNYLLSHPKAGKEYVKIKKDAVKKANGDGETYRKYKEKFIKKSIEKKFTAILIFSHSFPSK